MNRTELFNAITQVIRVLVAAKTVVLDAPEQMYSEPVVIALNEAIASLHEIRLYI